MVAYSFKARFAQPILDGTKLGTIRANGKRRHARAGEALQLYTGMRTRQCRKVKDETCVATLPIFLNLHPYFGLVTARIEATVLRAGQIKRLAREDGFLDEDDMAAFWFEEHGKGDAFDFLGSLIRWRPITWL